jgi:hypothetical protein
VIPTIPKAVLCLALADTRKSLVEPAPEADSRDARRVLLEVAPHDAEGAVVERREVVAVRREVEHHAAGPVHHAHERPTAVDACVIEDDDRALARERPDVRDLREPRVGITEERRAGWVRGVRRTTQSRTARRNWARLKVPVV